MTSDPWTFLLLSRIISIFILIFTSVTHIETSTVPKYRQLSDSFISVTHKKTSTIRIYKQLCDSLVTVYSRSPEYANKMSKRDSIKATFR